MTNALTGSALLDMIRKMEDADRTTQCLTCGYVRENGKPAFTAFYEAILEARGVITAKVEKEEMLGEYPEQNDICLLYTSPSPRDQRGSRMPSSA